MQITRNSVETAAGPSEWFTGKVYVFGVGDDLRVRRPHGVHGVDVARI